MTYLMLRILIFEVWEVITIDSLDHQRARRWVTTTHRAVLPGIPGKSLGGGDGYWHLSRPLPGILSTSDFPLALLLRSIDLETNTTNLAVSQSVTISCFTHASMFLFPICVNQASVVFYNLSFVLRPISPKNWVSKKPKLSQYRVYHARRLLDFKLTTVTYIDGLYKA